MALNFSMMGLGFHFFVQDEATLGLRRIDQAFKNVSASAEEMYHRTKASLDQMERQMGALGDARVQGALRNTGLALLGIGAASFMLAGKAVQASVQFESAFAGVRKTVDATEAEYAVLKQQIREMAREIPASAEEITAVAEAAGQLGIKKEAIMGFTRVMVDLGVATNMTSDQAATSLARLANITQMPQDQFDRLGSTVVALGNNLATTESEIVEMGLRLAGAGHQIGLTEAQILSFAGALSSVGINVEAGGSSMSRVMISIANAVESGGEQLELFAKVAGVSALEFRKAFKEDAATAIITFIEGLGRMSKNGENVFAVLDQLKLSEIEVRDALLRAAGAGDLFRQSLEIGTKAWEENTALAREAQERYKTTESQLKLLRNTIRDIGYTIGDTILPTVNAAVGWLREFSAQWSTLPDGLQKAVAWMVVGGGALAGLVGAGFLFISMIPSFATGLTILKDTIIVNKIATLAHAAAMYVVRGATLAWAGAQRILNVVLRTTPIGWLIQRLAVLKTSLIATRFAALGTRAAMLVARGATLAWAGAQWVLNMALSANPIGALIRGLMLATIGIIYLARNWERVTATIGGLWSKLTGWFSGLPAWGKYLLAIFMPVIGLPLLIAENWEKIKAWFAGLPQAIAGFISAIPGFLGKLFLEDIPYWIGYGIGYMLRLVWEGVEAVVGFFASLPGRVVTFVVNLATQIPVWWAQIRDTGIQIIGQGIETITGFFAELPGRIWAFLVTVPGTILNIGAELWSAARQAGSQAVTGMVDTVRGLPGQIWDILTGVAESLINFGPRLWEAAKKAAGRLWEGFKEGLGIHSPSYIERAMTNILWTSREATRQVETDFKRLNGLTAQPTITMATAYEPPEPAGAPALQIAAQPEVAAVVAGTGAASTVPGERSVPVPIPQAVPASPPPPAPAPRQQPAAVTGTLSKVAETIRQPIQLVLDGRVLAEIIANIQAENEARAGAY